MKGKLIMDYTTPEAQQKLKDLLRAKVLSVKFTKVDGSIRELQCTLQSGIVPETGTSKTPRAPSTETLAVFDTVNNGWRSFRYDTILEVKEL
jgi:hypothetical protein